MIIRAEESGRDGIIESARGHRRKENTRVKVKNRYKTNGSTG